MGIEDFVKQALSSNAASAAVSSNVSQSQPRIGAASQLITENATPAQVDEADSNEKINITVIGVGGGGCNTINRISKGGIKTARTIAVNTDAVHLRATAADAKILIGKDQTRGLGAGGYPEVAKRCAEASRHEVEEALGRTELVFLCAGMGGGTGTGATPIIADIAKKSGAIVVAAVTYPFALERIRAKKALVGIQELQKVCDTVIIIDNNKLVSYVPNLPINDAFNLADAITARAVKGIADTIILPSLINIDFADIKAIMGKGGISMISVGEGKGTNRIADVVRSTINQPLLDVDTYGAKGALLHICGGDSLTLGEALEVGEGLTAEFDEKANVIWGARIDPQMKDEVYVTSIITGVKSPNILGNYEKEKEDNKVPMPSELRSIGF
ncbi:Cell division protein FtsZ 1 [Candidatus Gugararchaeum adminiculabundum]|nr:Cell division protein FtsZ 1 [Candidatus Gugararchaeum adminiculabundum]